MRLADTKESYPVETAQCKTGDGTAEDDDSCVFALSKANSNEADDTSNGTEESNGVGKCCCKCNKEEDDNLLVVNSIKSMRFISIDGLIIGHMSTRPKSLEGLIQSIHWLETGGSQIPGNH